MGDPLSGRRLRDHIPDLCPLTPRELEALALVDVLGHADAAERMMCRPSTLRELTRRARRRLNVHTTAEAILVSRKAGWIDHGLSFNLHEAERSLKRIADALETEEDPVITAEQRAYLRGFQEMLSARELPAVDEARRARMYERIALTLRRLDARQSDDAGASQTPPR